MRKRILSAVTSAALLAGSLCGLSAAEEEAQKLTLSPRAQIEIADGEIRGITGIVTADWLRSQFDGEVKIVDHRSLNELTGDDVVSSLTYVGTPDESESISVYVPGDSYIDGKINLSDVTSILKNIAGWEQSCCEFVKESADLNRDGKVNLSDAATLLKYIAKWDVQIFDSAPVLTLFTAGEAEYKLLANDPAIDEQIVAAIKARTGKDIEVITEAGANDRFITVGKNLYEKYDFIDKAAVDALVGEDKGTMGYIDTYGGNVYLTAHTDLGIVGCVTYLSNTAFTPELDMHIAKGTVGELGDLETLVNTLYTTVPVKGLTQSHRLLHVTDSHLTTVYEDEETPERRADSYSRLVNWMMNMYRKPSYLYFEEYFNYAENLGAEGIMLTGDITDSPSKSNRDILEKAVDNCTVPSYYIYGNHDWTWNNNSATGDVYQSDAFRQKYSPEFGKAVDAYDEDWNAYYNVIDKGEYVIVSVDNGMYQFPVSRPTYNGVKKAFDDAKAAGKPVILMLHIPMHTDEMHEAIDHIQDNGYCIKPDSQYNKMYYDIITAEDSPVAAIFCGHVHESYETMVGDIPQYLTGAALEGVCRVVDLVPAE